jgi:hypothetical protein
VNLIVVKNGHERHDLATVTPGDVISSWWWDPDRQCQVLEIATSGVPASVEVTGEGWDCGLRGHRHWLPNGLPTSSCVECGEGTDG